MLALTATGKGLTGCQSSLECTSNQLLICYDCSGRHREYGTHISFVRSAKLDSWNVKQLKTVEISGNEAAREYFTKNGVPREGNYYKYSSDKVSRYRELLDQKVTSLLSEGKEEEIEEKVQEKVEEPVLEVKEEKKEVEVKKFKDFGVSNVKKIGKGKIKKAEIDFDFDDFDDFDEPPKKKEEKVEKPLVQKAVATVSTAQNDKAAEKLKSLKGKMAISSDDFEEDKFLSNQWRK